MPFRDAVGNFVGLVCASRDITERKLRQQQLASYAEELRQKNAQMEEELNMARELQQAFLPPQVFHFPRHVEASAARLHLCHHFLPAAIIGGDFFDVIPISETQAAVFVGDVMGHGVRPALVTAMVRGLTQQLGHTTAEPGRFLTELNHGLVGILRQAQMPIFATGFYLVLDTASGELSYANAGHPAPIHLHADGSVERLRLSPTAKKGMALGVFHEAIYSTSRCNFAAGDRIVLFTDGLFEVEGRDGTYFDEQKLTDAVSRHRNDSLPDTFSRLLDEIRTFSATQHFEDDLCLVGIDVAQIPPVGRA
jgi:sigma-B regulation protein RsbU (phosphoserine phosphatase)